MTDASFADAVYAVLIEDDPNQKFTSLRKSYAPVAFGQKLHPSPNQDVNIRQKSSCDKFWIQ